ncbi:condensation domain-containing protein, partial [Bradyrhizobium sp. 31Argb]|uniref:condensation domain-containing protein n=1 Tax=Bradyrhizobium sp. 31Argb TaxID=3141247 RepID=UPI003748680D
HDLRGRLDADAALSQLCQQEARTPFDLARGPLIRGRLIRLSDEAHVFLLTQHHIVSDGWSLGVFVRELTQLYRAFVAGDDDPLPPLALVMRQHHGGGEKLFVDYAGDTVPVVAGEPAS